MYGSSLRGLFPDAAFGTNSSRYQRVGQFSSRVAMAVLLPSPTWLSHVAVEQISCCFGLPIRPQKKVDKYF